MEDVQMCRCANVQIIRANKITLILAFNILHLHIRTFAKMHINLHL